MIILHFIFNDNYWSMCHCCPKMNPGKQYLIINIIMFQDEDIVDPQSLQEVRVAMADFLQLL